MKCGFYHGKFSPPATMFALFSASTIKTLEVIFLIACARKRTFEVVFTKPILRKYICMLVFPSVIENVVVLFPCFFCCFLPRARSFFVDNSKEPSSREKFSYCPVITRNQEVITDIPWFGYDQSHTQQARMEWLFYEIRYCWVLGNYS